MSRGGTDYMDRMNTKFVFECHITAHTKQLTPQSGVIIKLNKLYILFLKIYSKEIHVNVIFVNV